MDKWEYKIHFTDKGGHRQFQIGVINNVVNFRMAKEMAEQHASEFPEGELMYVHKLTDMTKKLMGISN